MKRAGSSSYKRKRKLIKLKELKLISLHICVPKEEKVKNISLKE
jgi:hypothetical protein